MRIQNCQALFPYFCEGNVWPAAADFQLRSWQRCLPRSPTFLSTCMWWGGWPKPRAVVGASEAQAAAAVKGRVGRFGKSRSSFLPEAQRVGMDETQSQINDVCQNSMPLNGFSHMWQ